MNNLYFAVLCATIFGFGILAIALWFEQCEQAKAYREGMDDARDGFAPSPESYPHRLMESYLMGFEHARGLKVTDVLSAREPIDA